MSGRTIEIAEHLWVVLETMARDMATDPRALVNQAVFNWARRNGYAVSAAATQAEAPAPAPAKAPAAVVARAVEAVAPVQSQAARIAAIDADVDRYCLVPVVVDAEFDADADADADPDAADAADEAHEADEADEADEAAADATDSWEDVDDGPEVAVAPSATTTPNVTEFDVAALRVAAAARIVAIDRAVDDVLPRPPTASAPLPIPVPAPAVAPAPAPIPAVPPARTPTATAATAAPAPVRAPAPAQVAASAPASAEAAASAHSRPTLTIAPATLAGPPPAAPAPAAVSGAPAAPAGQAKGRQRMDTSELNDLLGEVDDILGQSVVRDTALSPAIPFVLELRVRGTDQVCTVASEPVVIGRGAHCDLVVQSAEASREHAVVSRNGATYVIEDRGSSNGTWVGTEQVRSREIHSGDVFRIGGVDVVASFKVGEAQAKAG